MRGQRPLIEEVPVSPLDENGHEVPDPRPLSLPSGMKRPETLAQQVARLVRSHELARAASAQGFETLEESEDFDVGDDFDPSTPWELVFDPTLGKEISPAEASGNDRRRSAPELTAQQAAWKNRYVKAQQSFFNAKDRLADLFERRPAGRHMDRPEPSQPAPGVDPQVSKPGAGGAKSRD